jgi:hypothetical protein
LASATTEGFTVQNKTPEAVTLPQPSVRDDHSAPEIFASQVFSCDFDLGGVIRLTFFSNHTDHATNSVVQVVNLRLVMAAPMVENMLAYVGRRIEEMKATAPLPPPQDAIKH